MPDLQTELSKVITAWDSNAAPETQPTQPQPTQTQTQTQEKQMEKPLTINEQIFNYVLTWPGHTAQSYADQLNKSRGFNAVTVVTCINQMVRANMCRKDPDNRVQVIVPKYFSIPSTKKLQQMDKKKAKEATKIILPRTIEHAKTILEQAKIEVPVPKQPSNTLTAAYVLENISLGEGVKLFEALTRAFKG